MSKMPLKWHEGCLQNMRISYQRKKEEAARVQADADRLSRDIFHYEMQIDEATKRGLDGFDVDKFRKRSSASKG
jgi:hypothetical protein